MDIKANLCAFKNQKYARIVDVIPFVKCKLEHVTYWHIIKLVHSHTFRLSYIKYLEMYIYLYAPIILNEFGKLTPYATRLT